MVFKTIHVWFSKPYMYGFRGDPGKPYVWFLNVHVWFLIIHKPLMYGLKPYMYGFKPYMEVS